MEKEPKKREKQTLYSQEEHNYLINAIKSYRERVCSATARPKKPWIKVRKYKTIYTFFYDHVYRPEVSAIKSEPSPIFGPVTKNKRNKKPINNMNHNELVVLNKLISNRIDFLNHENIINLRNQFKKDERVSWFVKKKNRFLCGTIKQKK